MRNLCRCRPCQRYELRKWLELAARDSVDMLTKVQSLWRQSRTSVLLV